MKRLDFHRLSLRNHGAVGRYPYIANPEAVPRRRLMIGPLRVWLISQVVLDYGYLSASRVLGQQIVREIIYRVLRREDDGSLRSLANRNGHFMRIARVLTEVHADSAKPFTVEGMSRRAGMSIAAFHHNFKLVAGSSPLQYLKRIRLDRAKRLMLHDGYNASTAAKAVGYESASQFSREFKRQFGVTPSENVERLRQATGASIRPR